MDEDGADRVLGRGPGIAAIIASAVVAVGHRLALRDALQIADVVDPAADDLPFGVVQAHEGAEL